MKKLIFLAVFGASVLGLQAQNPFSGYQSDKTTGVATHEFSASATVVNLTQGARLDSLWIGKNGLTGAPEDTLTATPTAHTDNIEIGFDFPFAGKTMKYCGFTAAGLVFFGVDDAVSPAVNINDQTATRASDYALFQLKYFHSKVTNINWRAKPLTAGADACVRYERVQDTLFIAYENLQGEDKNGNVLTISFQYALDKNGKLSFRPVSIEPQQANTSSGDYYWAYSWGMVGQNGTYYRYLNNPDDGTSKTTSQEKIALTQASHPLAGESFNFYSPELCTAVATPQVTWDYDVQSDVLLLNPSRAMTWNAEAPAALFILSRESTLTGTDLPQDGTLYADGSSIGSSVFVATGKYNAAYKANYFPKGTVTGLTPNTVYHLYAFPYDMETCAGGPVYNTSDIPMQAIHTYFPEPASLRVDGLTDTSAELQIAVDAAATRYLLAFDTLQVGPKTDLKIDETLPYTAGGEIAFGERKLTVLDPCAETPAYSLRGLKQGKDYYYYAWSVNTDRNWYSRGAISCGVAPVRTLPASIDFASAAAVDLKTESWLLPAGWTEEAGNTYSYVLREDTSALKIFKDKMLSVQSTQDISGSASHSSILSPYVDRGEEESVKATIELVYWAQAGNEMMVSKPKEGDVLLVEYPDKDDTWREIARVGDGDAVRSDGTYTIHTDGFTPKQLFRLRFTVISTTPLPDFESSEDRSILHVGIRSLAFSASSCIGATNLQVVNGSLTSTGVTLEWKDRNQTPPLEYSVLYKTAAEKTWSDYPVTSPRVQLTDLSDGTYTAKIRTFCTADDSAVSTDIAFTISSCGPATLLRTTNLTATSVDLSWRGNGVGYAVVYAPRVGNVKADTLRTGQTSASLTGLLPNTPYSVHVITYCGPQYTSPAGASSPAYFNTPVECSVPKIEIVEGSETWQGVHFTITAPVPDRQIRIIPKDDECPVERYEWTSSKDTVKLYGFIDCENITYQVIARSICTVDTSEWSEPVEFTTLPKPNCGAPSNMWVSVKEGGRTATAHWTPGENNQSWLLMYKEKTAQRYDSIPVRENHFDFYGLKQNTVYTWRLEASCDISNLYSDLVYSEFSTANVANSSAEFAENLRVRVDRNQIDIDNPDGMYLKTMEVISVEGKRLKTYTINSSDNVFIPHTLPFGPAVFRITGEGGKTAVYKLMIP